MTLFTLKNKIKLIADSVSDINKVYLGRYVSQDIEYTALVINFLNSAYNDTYECNIKILDKVDADNKIFDKVQSDTLDILKDIVNRLSEYGILDYKLAKYKPIVNGDEVGWQIESITLVERGLDCE